MQIKNGFNLYYLYQYYFTMIMFQKRYQYVSHRLKKKYVLKKYLGSIYDY